MHVELKARLMLEQPVLLLLLLLSVVGAACSIRARATIAELGARFIRPGCVLLTHGMSRVVLALLQRAVASVRGHAGTCCMCCNTFCMGSCRLACGVIHDTFVCITDSSMCGVL